MPKSKEESFLALDERREKLERRKARVEQEVEEKTKRLGSRFYHGTCNYKQSQREIQALDEALGEVEVMMFGTNL